MVCQDICIIESCKGGGGAEWKNYKGLRSAFGFLAPCMFVQDNFVISTPHYSILLNISAIGESEERIKVLSPFIESFAASKERTKL